MIPNFEDGVIGVRRDANALAVVALTLGASNYDERAIAKGLLESSERLARAANVNEVKSAFNDVVSARETKGSLEKLEQRKVAQLRSLMKYALPSLSTDVKRLSRNEKTFARGKNAAKVIDDSTIIFAIATGCRENVDETLAPTEEKLWRENCDRLAAAALEFNRKANAFIEKKGSFDDLKDSFQAIDETCSSTCHAKFGGKNAD